MSTSKLSDLMFAMSQDPELERAYERDPEAVMRDHGLNEHEKHALRSGDEARVRRAMEEADGCVFAKFIIAPKREAEKAMRKVA